MCLSNTEAAVKGLPQYTQRRLFAGPCLNGCLDPGNERYFVNIGVLDLIHVAKMTLKSLKLFKIH